METRVERNPADLFGTERERRVKNVLRLETAGRVERIFGSYRSEWRLVDRMIDTETGPAPALHDEIAETLRGSLAVGYGYRSAVIGDELGFCPVVRLSSVKIIRDLGNEFAGPEIEKTRRVRFQIVENF